MEEASKIITVTLNPSLDRTLVTHYLAIGYHNRTTEPTRLDPAGEGVSISRALHALDAQTHSVISLGTCATGEAYQALLDETPFPVTVVRRDGMTRSSTIILDTGNQSETQVIEDATGATQAHFASIMSALARIITGGDIVIFAGDMPSDAPVDGFMRLLVSARQAGGRLVLSGTGSLLAQTLEAQPELVVMTQVEAEGYFNHPVRTREDMIYCARKVREQHVDKVMIIVEEDGGAILAAEGGIWQVELPEFEPGTTSGIKAALLAGYLAGRVHQRPVQQALELGAAAAAYTASQVGSEFGSLADVEGLGLAGTIEVDAAEE
ncbi:MAG: hypothetical protein JW910_01370 [Anaerolineae bacterium]|nr:hypothetical protein [Anaerolineae bacterium]